MQQFANYSANWLQARYAYHTNYTSHIKTVDMASTPFDPKNDAHWVRFSCQPGDVFQGPQLSNPRISTRDGCGWFKSAPTEDTETCFYVTNDYCGSSSWKWGRYCEWGQHTCVMDVINPPENECCHGYQTGTCVKTSYRGRKEMAAHKLANNLKKILDNEGLPRIIKNLRALALHGLPAEAHSVFQHNGYPQSACVFSGAYSESVKQSVDKGNAYLAAHAISL